VSDDLLPEDINAAARLQGMFKLRSGEFSTVYFDKYRFGSDPALLRRISQRMLQILPDNTEILAGLELGGLPIATAMSLESGLPVVFVRKNAKDYGTCQAVEGTDIHGRRTVLIEDVVTTGGAVSSAAALVRAIGADVIAVACAIWRGDGLPRITGEPHLPVFAALTREDLDRSNVA
jgi:orotate phosphoribosyltransferase